MNDEVALQLVKQLKRLNRWVTMFGILTLVTLGIIGFVLFQIVTFVKSGVDKVSNFGSSLNVKERASDVGNAVGDFFKKDDAKQ